MSKVVREEFVCDEHAQTHEAPYEFTISIKNRETGRDLGTYSIDACKDVVDWYKAHAVRVAIEAPKKRTPRKRSARRRNVAAKPSPQVVRRWAESRGLTVSSKGRVPSSVMEAYEKAH